MDSVFCVVELFFSFCKNNSHKKKTAHLLGGDTEFSDVNETIGFVKNEVCVYLVPWSWNCVDYVAHTCAVPEGRAATENVGDRQEWFKTDLGASLSLSLLLTPPTFLGLASLPPPPPSSSYPLNKAAEKGGERYARGGGGTRRRTEGGGPRGIDHQPTQDTPKTSSSSSSSKQVYTLPHWRRGLTVLRIHMRRRRRRRRIICVREMEKKGIISPTVDKIRD